MPAISKKPKKPFVFKALGEELFEDPEIPGFVLPAPKEVKSAVVIEEVVLGKKRSHGQDREDSTGV